MLTTQTFLHAKIFGDYLSSVRPITYRKADWQEISKGKERTVRLIVRAMLGVPSCHHGEQEHAMWCFAYPTGGMLVAYLARGTAIELYTRSEEDPALQEAVDFLITEVKERLKQV